VVVPSFVHYLEVLEGSDGDKLPGWVHYDTILNVTIVLTESGRSSVLSYCPLRSKICLTHENVSLD
jgi:hypothetical protein